MYAGNLGDLQRDDILLEMLQSRENATVSITQSNGEHHSVRPCMLFLAACHSTQCIYTALRCSAGTSAQDDRQLDASTPPWLHASMFASRNGSVEIAPLALHP